MPDIDEKDYGEKFETEHCPACGSPNFQISHQANGDADYETIGECRDCGYTSST